MTFLDLCAGIGGFTLGLERAGMTCVGQIEIDRFCTGILKKHWPDVPKWGDIKEVRPDELPDFELVCGGYPCQPFSVAGKRQGADDSRHLWPFIKGIVEAKRPNWCLFENVMGHISMGLDEVLADLEALGYTAAPICIPACANGAPHRRERVFIVANLDRDGFQRRIDQGVLWQSSSRAVAEVPVTPIGWFPSWHNVPAPYVCRAIDGIPNRSHRIRALGNAIVPQIAETIGRIILHLEEGFR